MASSAVDEFTIWGTWQAAVQNSSGYEESHLMTNLAAQLASKPPWAEKPSAENFLDERCIQLLFALQLAVINRGSTVRVADIGGGNGYMAVIARRQLGHLLWDWTVFESAGIASRYGVFESEAGIAWRVNRPESMTERYDVGLLSCTLQYVEDPYALLERAAAQCRYLLLMRVPLISAIETDLCTVQRPHGGVYEESQATWPCWLFARPSFDAAIQSLGEIVCRWVTWSETITLEGVTLPLEGLLVRTEP